MAPSANPTSVGEKQPCLLLNKLPSELRVEIYRYLVGRYTKTELQMKSKEYNMNRSFILSGPDHVYKFHPAVLGTNQRIREEAMEVLERENTFFHLSTREWHLWGIRRCGFAILAAGVQARHFPKIAVALKFDSAHGLRDLEWGDRKERSHMVFTLDDLPAVIAVMLRDIDSLRSPALCVSINGDTFGVSKGYHSNLGIVLDSLQQLRGLDFVEINGPISLANQYNIIATICSQKRSAKEIMSEVAMRFDHADEATEKNDLTLAISEYKSALYAIRGSSFDPHEEYEVLSGGQFDGIWAGWARDDAVVRLHSLIAAAYLKLNKIRLARVYVERIYGPLHTWDRRFNNQRFPLQITSGDHGVYADLLLVAAQISLVNGDVNMAVEELFEAEQLDPPSPDIQRLLQPCLEQRDKIREKRDLAWRRQQDIEDRKAEAIMDVARNRKARGDEWFQNCEFRRARSKYEAALGKIDGDFFHSEVEVLRLKLRAKLAVTSLKLDEYADVHRYADAAIAAVDDFWYNMNRPASRRNFSWAITDLHTAYWAKGIAFEKLGKIDAAVRNLELAMKCDDSCEVTQYRLVALKKLQQAGYVEEETRTEKLREKELRVRKR